MVLSRKHLHQDQLTKSLKVSKEEKKNKICMMEKERFPIIVASEVRSQAKVGSVKYLLVPAP